MRDRLVEAYLPLVRALARRHGGCGERVEDLVQVGSIGLLEAIDRYDPQRGTDLASFAIPTITGEIRRHLRDRTAPVRVPRRLGEVRARLRPARDELTARLTRQPTLAEVAREAGIAEAEAADAIASERARTVLALVPGEDPAVRGTIGVETDGTLRRTEDRLLLAAGFRAIAERERRILHLRYFAGLSEAEIAREVGLSQAHVSRLIHASLERLRGALAEG